MTVSDRDMDAVRLGERAQQVLDNPAWKHAWETVLEAIAHERQKLETKPERAEYLRMIEVGVCKARIVMETTIKEGKFAAESLRQENERLARAKEWLRRVV